MSTTTPPLLGIGLLPPPALTAAVVDMNRLLQSQGLSYNMAAGQSQPHCSLLQTTFTTVQTVQAALADAHARGTLRQAQLLPTAVSLAFGDRFVFIDCSLDPVKALHEQIVQCLAPHIVTSTERTASLMNVLQTVSPKEMENIQRYGTPYISDHLHPHLTVGAFRQSAAGRSGLERIAPREQLPSLEVIQGIIQQSLEQIRNQSFPATELALFEVGLDGALVNIVESFSLS